MVKLNLGCGDQILSGFINTDQINRSGAVGDDIIFLGKFKDSTVEMLYASHCLQCIQRSYVFEALRNWYRVLISGGKIIIEVPDIISLMGKYLKGLISIETLTQGVYGVDKEGIRQTCCFDYDYLKKLLEEVGFKDVKRIPQPFYSRHDLNTNICVEATK